MRYWEKSGYIHSDSLEGLGFQPLQSSIIILGYSAVLVNLIFFAVFAWRKLWGKDDPNPIFIFYLNMCSLFFQLYYFLF
jgi:hypothetical protein